MGSDVKTLETTGVQRVLVRATNWLGDAVMTTPAMGRIRERFPTARITLLATPLVAQLFTPHPWLDEVIVYERKGCHRGLAGRLRLAAQLRACAFDLAILFPNSLDAALVSWLARIPRRMGFRTDGRGLLLNYGAPPLPPGRTEHQSQNYLALLEQFGLYGTVHPQTLAVTPDEAARAAQTLQTAGIGAADPVLGINPGATFGAAKRWYPERFAAVADTLADSWGAKVIITGGSGERAIAEEIVRTMRRPCLNLVGRTNVRQMMSVINRCNFFVTNDSGPMHIAAAFDVPQVAIFGPTDSATTFPLSSRAVVVRQDTACAPCLKRECPTDHRCMTAITAEMVVDAAEKLKAQL